MEFLLIFLFLPHILTYCPSNNDVLISSCECVQYKESRLLSVKCLKTSELVLEDILCCNTTSNDTDETNIYELITVGSALNKFDTKLVENMTNLSILNLSRSHINHISWDNCNMDHLEILDVSNNNLETTNQKYFTCNRNIKQISLNGNRWSCELFFWFIDWARDAEDQGVRLVNKNDIFCYAKMQNSDDSEKQAKDTDPPELGLQYVVSTCPRNCSCRTVGKDRVIMSVNCSGRGWYDFPKQIPRQTRVLHLENNQIHSFFRFRNISEYSNVSKVHLDNNRFASLVELEGIKPGHKFAGISLTGNKLTQIPAHILERLECNFHLGGNPWNCECNHGISLRNFIIDKIKNIDDQQNITCAPTDKRYPNRVVSSLSNTELCYVEPIGFNVLDLVNAILGILIFLIFTKLVYDWCHFRKTGQLPLGPIALIQLWKKKRFKLNNMDI